ncbi:transposase [Roseateles sp. BYS96W]|uniref:Transposase n=1 Tax=Pelomonas nitida TaxID=3299027 RepID=A0ABW7G108_9BURK
MTEEEAMRKTTTYTPEFKVEAVKLVTDQGLSHQEAAAKLDIPTGTLSNWISQRRNRGAGGAAAAPGELTRVAARWGCRSDFRRGEGPASRRFTHWFTH